MKKYKKKEKGKKAKTKLLQIRLTEGEHKEVVEFIEKFGTTQREWLLVAINEIRAYNFIKDGQMWVDWKQYSYANRDKWDRQFDENSKCEECGVGHEKPDKGKYEYHQLERHHYAGYIGENAFKVQILCRKCHAKKPKSIDIKSGKSLTAPE